MNVACPTCATTYRVDPAKVPTAGVKARCQVCAAVFPVSPNGAVRPAPSPPTQRPAIPAGLRPSGTQPMPAATAPVAVPARSAGPPPAPVLAAAPLAPPKPAPAPTPAPAAPPPAPTPMAAPAPAPVPPAPAMPASAPKPANAVAAGARPVNPFLANDPATKARRLARALVSDLVVYNTARRDAALKNGNLKEEFAEEVKKSFEEYELQVGKELAGSTTYFNDALNEILAGGQRVY